MKKETGKWRKKITTVFFFAGLVIFSAALRAEETSVLGDFTVKISPGWVRAEPQDEEEQQNYLMAYKPNESPDGGYPVFMISFKTDDHSNETGVAGFLSGYAKKWEANHPGSRAVPVTVAGTNAILAYGGTRDSDTLFPVMIGKGNKVYTAAFIIPGIQTMLPACAKDLLNGLSFTEDVRQKQVVTQKIAPSVLAFRLSAKDGLSFALMRYAVPEVRQQFDEFNKALWPVTDPEAGWSFFFNTSIVCFGSSLSSGELPVLFYHPWSDVLLLSLWKQQGDGAVMTDAEVLMGDFLRKKGHPQFQTVPLWQRTEKMSALLPGIAAAETLTAFEKPFRQESHTLSSWRNAVPNLGGGKTLESNRYGAGALLAWNLRGLVEATSDEAGSPFRPVIQEVLAQLREGRMPEILKEARETLPESAELLKKISKKDLLAYRITAFVVFGGKGYLMLAKGDYPDLYMTFVFEGPGKQAERIDLLSFQEIYKSWPPGKSAGGQEGPGGVR